MLESTFIQIAQEPLSNIFWWILGSLMGIASAGGSAQFCPASVPSYLFTNIVSFLLLCFSFLRSWPLCLFLIFIHMGFLGHFFGKFVGNDLAGGFLWGILLGFFLSFWGLFGEVHFLFAHVLLITKYYIKRVLTFRIYSKKNIDYKPNFPTNRNILKTFFKQIEILVSSFQHYWPSHPHLCRQEGKMKPGVFL